MAALKKPVKIALMVAGGVGLLLLGKCAFDSGIIPKPAFMESRVPDASDSLAGDVNRGVPREAYELAAEPVGNFQGCARVLTIPWNATSSLALANGGARTTSDSLVRQYSGGCLEIERQDDYSVIQQNLVRYAQDRANGNRNPTNGAPFAIIMGDGLPAFAEGLREPMGAFDQDIVVVGVVGFSDGEDKCMGRPLDGDPQKARGSLIAAVPRDGDQNLCIKWAADNGIPVNTDNTVYDPDAINFVDTTSFTEADDKFITGYSETRPVARNGVKNGETARVTVDGVGTWTPGDVTVVEAVRSGRARQPITTWASTREYNQQMPSILIANRQWAEENRQFVVGLLRAVDRASFQIRGENGGQYLREAGAIMANIHGSGGGDEADPAFWTRYFVGQEVDTPSGPITLGGSRVSTLAEVRDFLGLGEGTLNIYKGVYEIFGNYAKTFYPTLLPRFPAYEDVVTGEYVQAALRGVSNATRTATPEAFAQNQSIQETVSQRAYSIEFDTGAATIRADSMEQLFELANQSGMTNLRIRIDGHTDNTGNPTINQTLSRQRAQAVADWLTAQAPATFPANRIQVRGYGDTAPVASNDTEAGRQQNRRVVITLGN